MNRRPEPPPKPVKTSGRQLARDYVQGATGDKPMLHPFAVGRKGESTKGGCTISKKVK